MKITVVMRIIFGLLVSAGLLIFLAITALSNQAQVVADITKLNEEANPAVSSAHRLETALQDAALAITQYAALENEALLSSRKGDFQRTVREISETLTKLEEQLSFAPETAKSIQPLTDAAENYTKAGAEFLTIQDELRVSEALFETNYAATLASWNKYEEDAKIIDRVLLNLANDQQNSLVTGYATYTIDRIIRFRSALYALITVDSFESLDYMIEDSQIYTSQLKKRLETIKEQSPILDERLAKYVSLIEAAGQDDGIVELYRRVKLLQDDSTSQLTALTTQADELRITIESVVAQLGLLTQESVSNIDATNKQSTQTLILVSIGALLIAAITGVSTVKAIRKPLKTITYALRKISDGDFRVDLEVNREDEFGQIAKNVKRLVEKFTDVVSDIKSNAERVEAFTEGVTQKTESNTRLLDQQKTQSAEVSLASDNLNQSSFEISDQAKSSSALITTVNQQLHDGNAKLNQSVNSIKLMAEDLDLATTVVRDVEQETNNISQILDVIRGIAEQTNLLALNAAIEAARAGEQGRGFAVVADEVRSLASRTQQSTTEIDEMIDSLQKKSARATDIMNQSQGRSKTMTEDATQTLSALNSVASELQDVQSISSRIAEGTLEQQSNANQVSNSIGLIADLSDQISASAHQNITTFKELRNMTHRQTELVAQFQID